MRRKTALVGTVAYLLTACAAPPTPKGISWEPCEQGFQCATITVPMDHDDPGGATIRLALNRLAARHDPLGSLIIGAGGPGDSGLNYVASHAVRLEPLRARYHIIGVDSRGIGASTRVRCLDDNGLDEYYAAEMIGRQAHEATVRYVDACAANSAGLLPFVGTENVARDLDAIRAALGEEKLNYFGFSYATRVGLSYAEQFPGRVGRMVLDSIDNPVSVPEVDVTDDPPPRTDNEDNVAKIVDTARLDALLAELEANPRRASDGRAVNASVARTALFEATFDPVQPFPTDDIDAIQALADTYNGRGPDGTYDHDDDIYLAVSCLIGDPEAGIPDRDEAVRRVDRIAATAAGESPHFGAWLVYSTQWCDVWPAAPTFRPHEIHAPGAPPILLLNNDDDLVTPLSDAQAVEADLDGAVLVVRDSADHGVFLQSTGTCIEKIIIGYVIDGAMPPEHTRCT